MKAKQLILLTHGFPYGDGEQFLETEMLYLSQHFERVYIYSTTDKGKKRDLPKNVEVVPFTTGSVFSVKKMFLKWCWLLVRIYLAEFGNHKRKHFYKNDLQWHKNNLYGLINDAENFSKELKKYPLTSTKIYSYWFGPWGDILSMLNAMNGNKTPFITRIHGHDYDVDRRKSGFIPYRSFLINYVQHIVSVSEYGSLRIKAEYPAYKNIHVSRLGVPDKGDSLTSERDEFHIVSCSSLIPLKRVHLIVELIRLLPFKVKWTHFGDGPLMSSLKELVKDLPTTVTVNLKGVVENKAIIDFYKTEYVDLFVNVSEHEGIPVSIMEAISFGIPSIGCRICGVPEIVTQQSGILLERQFDVRDAANKIIEYKNLSPSDKLLFKENTKHFWHKNYNSDINYMNFIHKHLEL